MAKQVYQEAASLRLPDPQGEISFSGVYLLDQEGVPAMVRLNPIPSMRATTKVKLDSAAMVDKNAPRVMRVSLYDRHRRCLNRDG